MSETMPVEVDVRRELSVTGAIVLQLVLVLLVVHQFQLESRTFFNVMVIGAVGFVINALLPLKHRLAFFAALSILAIPLVLGWRDGLFLIAFGLSLIGACHLPVRMAVRIGVIVSIAAVFALWRADVLPAAWSGAIWPILGSMFMFRIALYLHALAHEERQPQPARTLAYFFMLPNICFPLFPVVDYLTFRRTYYDADAGHIYQTGIKWIVRGLTHLIIYRFVYLTVGDPIDVETLGELVRFLLATFFLYLRVSGEFHIITGMLHLFGFRLPETHHLYFLSQSFTDFWRRINIYWKDFMMKLVFYPSFFRLRRHGPTTALVLATILVFASTWILHSYQWFWLRGGFPLKSQDGLFWGLLAGLVVMGSLREMKQKPDARKRRKARLWDGSLALRTVGTFTAICVLWSLWSSESLVGWLLIWGAALRPAEGDFWLLGGLLLMGLVIAGLSWPNGESTVEAKKPLGARPVLQATAALGAILVLGSTALYQANAPRLAAIVQPLQRSTLNQADAALQNRGYYENLDITGRMTAQLWELQARRPAHWLTLTEAGGYRNRDDFLGSELVPGVSVDYLDAKLTTNRFGMRDKERTLAKEPGVFRIAVLGPSLIMGSGVADDETITVQLEERLNSELASLAGVRFEVLNFGVSGYSLTQQLALFDDRVKSFQPDVVLFTETPRSVEIVARHLLETAHHRREIPYVDLRAIYDKTGVALYGNDGVPIPFDRLRSLFGFMGIETSMPWSEAQRRLRRAGDKIVAVTLKEIAVRTRQIGATPALVMLNEVLDPPLHPPVVLKDAEAAGFLVFDLLPLWDGRSLESLRIAEWDNHPNAEANRLVADRLFELITKHHSQLGLSMG